MPQSERVTKVELEIRIRTVQEWILEDWPDDDIIAAIMKKWPVQERQAYTYLKHARERWVEQNKKSLSIKRATRVASVKKLLKQLPAEALKTPGGINAALRVHKYLAKLDGIEPTRQMIDALNAEDQGKQADPLAPTTSELKIIPLPSYEGPEAVDTTNS